MVEHLHLERVVGAFLGVGVVQVGRGPGAEHGGGAAGKFRQIVFEMSLESVELVDENVEPVAGHEVIIRVWRRGAASAERNPGAVDSASAPIAEEEETDGDDQSDGAAELDDEGDGLDWVEGVTFDFVPRGHAIFLERKRSGVRQFSQATDSNASRNRISPEKIEKLEVGELFRGQERRCVEVRAVGEGGRAAGAEGGRAHAFQDNRFVAVLVRRGGIGAFDEEGSGLGHGVNGDIVFDVHERDWLAVNLDKWAGELVGDIRGDNAMGRFVHGQDGCADLAKMRSSGTSGEFG